MSGRHQPAKLLLFFFPSTFGCDSSRFDVLLQKKIKKESLLDPEYEELDFDCPKLFLWLINAVEATCK